MTSVMTFVDWVKWLVGFLCTHLHTHTHTYTQQFKCAACEILVFYFVVFFLCELHLFQFLCMPHILFSSLRASYFFPHLLPATATAAAEVV